MYFTTLNVFQMIYIYDNTRNCALNVILLVRLQILFKPEDIESLSQNVV